MGELLSLRGYAAHRRARGLPGGSLRAVQKARDRGAITVGADGVDFERADAEWAENRAGGQNGNGRARTGPPRALVESQRLLLEERRRLLRLDYRRRRGELVEASRVRGEAFARARRARNLLLGLGARVGPVVAGLGGDVAACIAAIDAEVSRVAAEIGGSDRAEGEAR